MEALLALTRRLTARRDLDSLLAALLEGSAALIPGADFVCVFLYQPELNALVPVGGVGFNIERLKGIQLQPGESLTGKAFIAQEPLLLPNPAAIREAQANLAPDHDRAVREAVSRPDNPVRSSMAIPMRAEGRTMGVLVIDNYDTDRDFDRADLAVATSLADHAAVAVLNAQDYQRVHSLSQDLQRTMTVQKRLMASMMGSESSLQELLRSLFTLIRRPCLITDSDDTPLAAFGGPPRNPLAFAIETGQELLGQLFVEGPVLGFNQVAVEQTLPLAALELLKQRARQQARTYAQMDAFRRIWAEDKTAMQGLLHASKIVGAWCWLIAANLADPTAQHLSAWAIRENIPFMRLDSALLFFVGQDKLETLRDRIVQGGSAILSSPPLIAPESMGRELRALVLLWRVSDTFGKDSQIPSLSLSDYPEFRVLATLPDDSRQALVHDVLAPFEDDPIMVQTLLAWAFSERSYERTARRLHTHPNTIRYRLEKAALTSHQNLTDDQGILRLRLACYCRVDLRL